MSSFNRPPRPFAYPDHAAEEAIGRPGVDQGAGQRALPSFYERIPEYDPALHEALAFEASEPTHSWLNLELIPSWLRPFALDANTRFTRTPDHWLRPRDVETETAPAPEVSGRGWHFLFEAADAAAEEAAADPDRDAPSAIGIPPGGDEAPAFALPEGGSETAALQEVDQEALQPVPFALEPPAVPMPLIEAGADEALVEVRALERLAFGAMDGMAAVPNAVAVAELSPFSEAAEPDLDPQDMERDAAADVPDHLWGLLRLVVLGRAATPPVPACEQDLDPGAVAESLSVDEDAQAGIRAADAFDDEDLEEKSVAESEAAAAEEEDEKGEAAAFEADDEAFQDDAFEDEESQDACVEEAGADDEDGTAFDAAEDEQGEEAAGLDEDAGAFDDEVSQDDWSDAPHVAADPIVGGAPAVSAEASAPALWHPYQQSVSARFLGAMAPLAAAPPVPSTAAPAANAAPAPRAPSPAGIPLAAPEPSGPYELPPLDLLREPPLVEPDFELSEEFLDQSSAMLQQVLRDFGVRGEVIDANPGPVVTLYEFEPAPGVKSSRVIGLSADIARSMSAVSARVAVVEGRNVIGIELPNRRRETVWLRELLASQEFAEAHPKLGLGLGKTIGGVPVIADLARMPHLLVAGTTGSGKSVAINTMILSLLYRHTPEACRLIMIDPKMLELSVYEGIPHLLTPVVTDPKKAIIALKWAVKEMEERYRKMSRLAVRNIDGYNARVREAAARAEIITRNVQVGFDRETGEALFEEQEMDLAPLPYIVVIVDEMADLMMVAGKEIEGAIQRLAQMARAAGIHLVMATQRPSVDVITGTIKANFPTRISFQVTSKIDSRTILGEMGAETLLGQGDMLFMAGGGRITRVHGPFVSDGEVEKVVAFLKAQGGPDYLDAVILDEAEEADEEDEAVFDRSGLGEAGGDLYEQAVAIVMRDRKASTSYIQRRLQVGYNKAASLMERMETEGIVGPANHAGKREILTFSRPG